jgi:hypothetical protein
MADTGTRIGKALADLFHLLIGQINHAAGIIQVLGRYCLDEVIDSHAKLFSLPRQISGSGVSDFDREHAHIFKALSYLMTINGGASHYAAFPMITL